MIKINKEQLIEIWECGILNEQGKDTLIDCFVNGEDSYNEDVPNAMDNNHPQSRRKIHTKEVNQDE